MSFANYCAIQTISRPAFLARWTNTRTVIPQLEAYLNGIIDPIRGQDPSIVVIPRFNGSYLSFRLCGLEIFRVAPDGRTQFMLMQADGKIRNAQDQATTYQSVQELPPNVAATIGEVCTVLQSYRMGAREKSTRELIPGFQPEHWLESIIMADNHFGVQNRARLGLNTQLSKCVTQAPTNPGPGGGGGRFIDILSVLQDDSVKIVELKINDDVTKAEEELDSYSQWFSTRNYLPDYPFPPEVRWVEGYLPTRRENEAGGGWAAPIDPLALVVATTRSSRYSTVLLRKDFINHILDPFAAEPEA